MQDWLHSFDFFVKHLFFKLKIKYNPKKFDIKLTNLALTRSSYILLDSELINY